jgi:hypothetical protein
MSFSLEESLDYAEQIIKCIERNEEDEEMLLKLEATLMCFQFHIKTLTGGLQ